eukprot:PITA_22319
MLEDIGKLDWVKNTVDHAKRITKFIYNHSWILSLMRRHTGGRDIIRPAITRFATHFLTLQSMLSQHRNLQKIFSSEEWNQSRWSHKQNGRELKKKVNEEIFWRKAAKIVKVAETLVKVLWLVDGERLAMGFICEAMDQAKEKIKREYKGKVAKYGPIWAITGERWNNQLHHPIHATGYFWNPRYHYKALATGALKGEVRNGLIDCIDHMIPLECDQLEIHRQVTTFNKATSTFRKNLAKVAREADEPTQWWEDFGSHCLELQKFAIRILSQDCSATRHNQLLNKRPNSDPIVLEDIDPTSDWVVESHPTEFDFDEDLDLDLQVEVSLEHNVQLNIDLDPLVPALGPALSPPVVGTPSAQPRQKHISRLSQLAAAAQPASATTSTVAAGDDEEEEPWAGLSDSDP